VTAPLVYRAPGTELAFAPLPWDTRAFGRECAELTVTAAAPDLAPDAVARFMREAGLATVTCRQPGRDRTHRALLRALGFHHAELQLELVVRLGGRAAAEPGTRLRRAVTADRAAVEGITRNAFLQTRFHDIPTATAEQIGARFVSWSADLWREAPELCLVLDVEGEVAGLFVSRPTGAAGEIYLALAATAPGAPLGFGYYLYSAALAEYARLGWRRGTTAIDAANVAVLGLWMGLGARVVAARDVFLWHAERGPAARP
jgi:hypothetical protein